MEGPRLNGIGMTSARTRERLVQRLQDQGIKDQRVLDRIRNVPRHLFMDEALATRAMQCLHRRGSQAKVLEIGTGCGYQTAVLAPLVKEIYTIERISSLLGKARRTLRELRIRNVHCRHEDGNLGWPARAPYDGILLTAAPHAVPPALFDQLVVGGRLIAPVGPDGRQELMRYTKGENRLHKESLGAVSFVPLLSGLQR